MSYDDFEDSIFFWVLIGVTGTYQAQELCHHFETEMMVPGHFLRHFLGSCFIW